MKRIYTHFLLSFLILSTFAQAQKKKPTCTLWLLKKASLCVNSRIGKTAMAFYGLYERHLGDIQISFGDLYLVMTSPVVLSTTALAGACYYYTVRFKNKKIKESL